MSRALKLLSAHLVLLVLSVGAAGAFGWHGDSAPGGIPVGEGEFHVETSRGPVIINTFRPGDYNADSPIWIIMPGARRDTARHIAFDYYDVWAPLAEQNGALLLVPEFSQERWPTSWQYQSGNIRTSKLRPVKWEHTAFNVVERAFQQAVAMTGSHRKRFNMFGHGAGAQFVQRYVLYSGGRYVQRAVAANPGWYTLPDYEYVFPYGLRGGEIPQSTLHRAFAADFVLLLGTGDVNYGGPLRNTAETLAQGKTRYERGHFYFARSQKVAREIGARFNWRLEEVPGAGHYNDEMAPSGAAILAAQR